MDMGFLLDPNIAYLILVGTGLLILMGAVTPGTGLIEVGALFGILLTGYTIISMPINPWALVVLIVGVVFFMISILRPARSVPVWLLAAIAFFEIGSVFLFQGENVWLPAVNPILALIVVVITSGFLWFIARKAIEDHHKPPHQELSKLIGQFGEAKTDIGAFGGGAEGTVQVNGELWSATSREPIAAGAKIQVLERQGFTLVVKPA